MSRVLYFDCFSSISGDMTLGALIDAGLPLADLTRALGSLALGEVELRAEKVLRTGVSATKFSVIEGSLNQESGTPNPASVNPKAHPHRHLPAIFKLIDQSALSPAGKDRAKGMFQRLAEVEAGIHQMPVEKVHLHEVGALDSIIDIVGVVFAMDWASADRVVCSPLNVGGGMVHSAHGVFPVPAPATVTLLGRTPVYSGAVQKELVTPTGALIATTYASSFGPLPAMAVERVGYGAGDRDDPVTPNVLRVLIGEETALGSPKRDEREGGGDRVTVTLENMPWTGKYRINGIVSDLPQFQKAFDCPASAPPPAAPAPPSAPSSAAPAASSSAPARAAPPRRLAPRHAPRP